MREEMHLLFEQARFLREQHLKFGSDALLEGLSKRYLQWADGEDVQDLLDWVQLILKEKPEVLDNPQKNLVYRKSEKEVVTVGQEEIVYGSEGDFTFFLETKEKADSTLEHYKARGFLEIPPPPVRK